jgi:hypothetical protein
MRIGRNDPCPCGSGRKYKKCCWGRQEQPSQALYYQRLSEAHDRLFKRLVPYATKTFGKEAVLVAMDEFLLWPEQDDETGEETFDRLGSLFWPWFLFNWEYASLDAEVELPGPEDRTVAELYAEEHGIRLDPLERILIESINRKPYSFWEVLQVDKGRGMDLQDVLLGSRIEVQERSGSEFVQTGDLVFGRAVSVDGVGMIMGLGTSIIPPRRKPDIIELRKKLRDRSAPLTEETLYEWDVEIRELYFNIDESLHTPPKLCNTDGDPLEFHRLIYAISSAEEAFEKLSDLCVTMEAEELLADAKYSKKGRISRVEIPWDRVGHKINAAMPNTLLGRIVIDEKRLSAEVNSAKRAEAFRHEIHLRLGDKACFKVDEIQDVKSMMAGLGEQRRGNQHSAEHSELIQSAEVREKISEIIVKHWECWVDQRIPALGGKTPRMAVKTPDGREAVEALLKDAERGRVEDSFTAEANREGARRVRELLGLKDQ